MSESWGGRAAEMSVTRAEREGLRYADGSRVEPSDVCSLAGDPDRDGVTVRGVDPAHGVAVCEWRGRALRVPASALRLVRKGRERI